LKSMEGVRSERAAFECVIVIAVPRGPALVYSGRCEGEIAETPRGKNGFGYDPGFFYKTVGKNLCGVEPDGEKPGEPQGNSHGKAPR